MQRWTCVSFVAVNWLLGSVYGGCVPIGNATDCESTTCYCNGGVMTCSHNNLSTVPTRLMAKVTVLLLKDNNIENLNEFDFENCSDVQTIDLSQNSIVSISNFTFKDTRRLRHLLLQCNLISYSTLNQNTFAGLANIRTLDISNNAWKNSKNYGYGAFKFMKSLTKLHIDVLPGIRFPKEISKSKNLERLSLCDDGNLQIITNETFAEFANSNLLNVSIHSSRSLREVEPMSFAHFKNLRVLDISDNHRLGLKNASKAFYGLQYTRITKLVLMNLNPETYSCRIANGFFRYLNLTNITELVMSRNRITKIASIKLSSELPPHLKKLDLSYNQIRNVQLLVRGLSKLDRLQRIDLSHQLTPTPRYRFKPGFLEVRADYSKTSEEFESLDAYRKCPNDERVNTTCTEDSSLIFGRKLFRRRRLRILPICLELPQQLKELRIREAIRVDAYILPQVTICNGKDLELIDLSSNGLRQVRGPIIFTEPVTDLKVDLSDNQIDCISSQAFFYSRLHGSSLSGIDLSRNRLGEYLQNDENGNTFQYLEELQKLNLSKNGIKYLPPNVFAYNRKLTVLDLSNNALKVIEFYFSHMQNLVKINLSDNLIITLTDDVMRNMTLMFGRHDTESSDVVQINLNGNPVQCSCDNVEFLRWIAANRNQMADIEFYACERRTKLYLNFSNTDGLVESLDYRCKKWIAVIVSGLFTGMALLVLAVMVVCYRNRWEFRYACLKLTHRSRRYQQLTDRHRYRYDAFVVYDASDRKWVNDELMPHLEPQNLYGIQSAPCVSENSDAENLTSIRQTFRLCVHERDFPPGEEIITNIWTKMELSRKVILVISKTFTTSRFCEYEMNLARLHSVELGRNVIVPIILEMPDFDRVSDSLRWILRKVTYIEWPTEKRDRGEFWDLLEHVLSDVDCI